MVCFGQVLHTYTFCLDNGKHIGDEASPCITLAGCGQMLITLEPHCIF